MVLKKLIKIDKNQIDQIKNYTQVKVFNSSVPLFYEGQTPVVAILVLEGVVNLMKNKKVKSMARSGTLIGLTELLNNSISKVSAEAQPQTSVCFLDKSTIFEIIKNPESELSRLFKSLGESLA